MKEDSPGVSQVVLFLVYSTVYAPLVLGSISNLVFYAQSTITVISGRYTFHRYTIT